ncbi:MAG: hypothetical protein JW725_00170, partial [Candidatus Babeliaceae bacterium]|nr:hypothetical protein [Candidatus Babeliaceae bacterium]
FISPFDTAKMYGFYGSIVQQHMVFVKKVPNRIFPAGRSRVSADAKAKHNAVRPEGIVVCCW